MKQYTDQELAQKWFDNEIEGAEEYEILERHMGNGHYKPTQEHILYMWEKEVKKKEGPKATSEVVEGDKDIAYYSKAINHYMTENADLKVENERLLAINKELFEAGKKMLPILERERRPNGIGLDIFYKTEYWTLRLLIESISKQQTGDGQ